jgi:ABC-type transport system involved in multi-copper enzyme maturation permease subunit
MSTRIEPIRPHIDPPPSPDNGTWRATLHAEWIKFRTVRGWLIGLLVAAFLLLTFTFIVTHGKQSGICTGAGDCHAGHPYVPTGPNGQAVTDSYQYYSQTLTGDGALTARVTSLTGLTSTGPANQASSLANTRPGLAGWAKAGVLITPSTRRGAAYAAVMATGAHGVRFQNNYTSDQPGLPGDVTAGGPRWLRLTRTGDTITAADSADGTNWHTIGTARLDGLPATVNIGLFVASPVIGQGTATQATARFDQLSLTATGAWQARSIGMSGGDYYPTLGPGSAQASGDTITVTGSGDLAPAVSGLIGGDTPADIILFGLIVAIIVMIVIATSFVAGEYRHGLIRMTFAATPHRSAVLVAKAAVIGAVGCVLGAVLAAIALPVGRHMLTDHGNYVFPTGTAATVRIVTGAGLLLALAAIGTVGLAALVRRSAAAVSLGIAVFVLPTLLGPGVLGQGASGGLNEWLYRATPAAGLSVLGSLTRSTVLDYPYTLANGYYPLGPWAGLAVMAAWTFAALGAAVLVVRRRDV